MLFDIIKNTKEQHGSKGKDALLPIGKAFWSHSSLLFYGGQISCSINNTASATYMYIANLIV